ncbi:uroporphyrinogen decarboxylase family protein [Pontiella sulfatireligans]|uniref:Uroporphyrinogen decarboxylase (URO-D) domain-containing protein n=1 Tax=Pontiella sulfatireligans TaxID=2750658 RepID=A0A6C2URS9_9BACT|nr:uroporphyrinogen decarboxylase family protein [Pontiella sulfatireligans]VGO21927.1 hypothetical protein SCARR_04007 [Pontiella sulfatireligans]
MTSRELVTATLNFEHTGRIPRQTWLLPWAELNFPGKPEEILSDFPCDLVCAPDLLAGPAPETEGDAHRIGTFIDEWNCIFENKADGIIGEVKQPIVEDWSDTSRVHIPRELLAIDTEQINAFCHREERFVLRPIVARPFERLQFIRGTENLLIDLALEEDGLHEFIREMHAFHIELTEAWAQTDVDAIFIMDDWGTQNNLLINPDMWREFFKPLYKAYIDMAHAHGKKVFMHSDGNILSIYPDLIEIGLDAINSQIWCMGLDNLAPFAGQITFWGEMDRQHALATGTPDDVVAKSEEMKAKLYADGGLITQCEFGPGAHPANVRAYLEAMR